LFTLYYVNLVGFIPYKSRDRGCAERILCSSLWN
jgi:hypothetical protein